MLRRGFNEYYSFLQSFSMFLGWILLLILRKEETTVIHTYLIKLLQSLAVVHLIWIYLPKYPL